MDRQVFFILGNLWKMKERKKFYLCLIIFIFTISKKQAPL